MNHVLAIIDPGMSGYFERLRTSARARDSLICVGLDPSPERIDGGASGAARFCRSVIEATAEHVCAYKPNTAFWEQYGAAGWEALRETCDAVPDGIPVIVDAKRGDIPETMRAYARAIFDVLDADAVTVHAYLGADSLAPFTSRPDKGTYVVCRTSNPGAADLQQIALDGQPFYMHVGRLAAEAGELGNVGLVVGATAPQEVARMRAAFPHLPFLLPGVGAQGGDLAETVAAAWNGDPASCLVTITRSVMYADRPDAAARSLRDQVRQLVPSLR